jgi:hypothetical protein
MLTVKAKTLLREGSTHAILLIRQRQVDNNQTNLFGRDYTEEWLNYIVNLANRMPSKFFMSQLRAIAEYGPGNQSLWGQAGKALLRNGYRTTGCYRKSPIESRRGGTDKEYERICN